MSENDYREAISAAQTIGEVTDLAKRIREDAGLCVEVKMLLIKYADRREDEIGAFYHGRPLNPNTPK